MKLFTPLLMYKGLPRDTYFIALAKFVLGLGNFIIPFILLLLTQKLGYSTTIAGGLAMGVIMLFLVGNLIGGKISDTLGHKRVMVCGEMAGSLVLIVCGFFSDWPVILPALLFLSYFFYGVSLPASNALVADISSPNNRSAVMSLSYLAYSLGSGIGPILAGYLFWNYTDWIFWGNGFASLIAVFIVLFGVNNHTHDDKTNKIALSELEKATEGSVWRVFKERPRLLIFGILCTFLWFALNQKTITTPLYLSHIFDKQGPILYGQLMTFASILVVIITPILIKLTSNLCDIKNLAISGFVFALGYSLILFYSSVSIQFVAWFFLVIGEVLLLTKEGVYLANHSPISHRGRISGILTTIRHLLLMPTYILIGAYIQSDGYVYTWGLIITVSLVAGLMCWLFSVQQNKRMRG
ncbi:putative transporter [Xenorhabdus poinarii G6]|uniref:Putative transporter n=1 Tax=Xenorhabdus poinarii G6 TaxID=1354304 RepID=A0A068R5L0_9GAMM|nr:MFS transporter [Xenorhabdus poinarii]CDG21410.1 putative transporter [Xenorhabdus poinarii G6]